MDRYLQPVYQIPQNAMSVEEVAVVGEKCTAILQATNFGGELCKESIKSLECNYVSEITGIGASCSVERSGQSQYEISYQPTIKERHQLHVKVQGQRIRGSPFSVAVKSPVEKLGTPILAIGGVGEPLGAAINQRGEVVVAEFKVIVCLCLVQVEKSFGLLVHVALVLDKLGLLVM